MKNGGKLIKLTGVFKLEFIPSVLQFWLKRHLTLFTRGVYVLIFKQNMGKWGRACARAHVHTCRCLQNQMHLFQNPQFVMD